jgi:hypothetical protein
MIDEDVIGDGVARKEHYLIGVTWESRESQSIKRASALPLS